VRGRIRAGGSWLVGASVDEHLADEGGCHLREDARRGDEPDGARVRLGRQRAEEDGDEGRMGGKPDGDCDLRELQEEDGVAAVEQEQERGQAAEHADEDDSAVADQLRAGREQREQRQLGIGPEREDGVDDGAAWHASDAVHERHEVRLRRLERLQRCEPAHERQHRPGRERTAALGRAK